MEDIKVIDAKLLSKMFLAGAKNLEVKKEWINELNVFPVPDGDTGTNMTMTIMNAAKEVSSLEQTNDINMESLCKAISSKSLSGARGNSGVILSQLLRGFTKTVQDVNEIDIKLLSKACDKAVETAYKAVMKPKEGTILTVAKGIATKAKELSDSGCDNLSEYIKEVINYGEYVLSQTPEMLPVLKQAGVVDSGGQGLIEVLHGASDAFFGKEINLSDFVGSSVSAKPANISEQAEADIKFGYCTEFIIMLDKLFNIKHELDFKAYLESIGDSIVVVADDEIVKVHVHTNDPGLAIQKALKYGSLSNMKIDNMRLEHQERLFKEQENKAEAKKPAKTEPMKEFGFVSISAGDGLSEIFKGLGVDCVIEGGQTMNPSTEDIVDACEMINAKNIFVFPNNKNIIMAANQAQSLIEGKNVIVIPTKTVPQGITALINYVPNNTAEANKAAMEECISSVATGQVTYAVRDTMIDEHEIHEGDYMGIADKGLASVNKDISVATVDMVSKMINDDSELITVYYGADIKESVAEEIAKAIEDKFDGVEVDLQYGGQPVYYFIISIE